jgi:NAD(P)H-dependent flavin oxidoreductase YrpB (nitropropane dioxygenase family)
MQRYNIPPMPEEADGKSGHGISGDQIGWQHAIARASLEEGFKHSNCKVMVNALGTPPADIMAECKAKGILVGALAGRLKHALAHKAGGVDFIIAQGHEAGGHTGDVTTMVLVPQVVDAVAPLPVLAAGGIGSGRQVAAAMALGAQGVWCGSIWLTSPESEVAPLQKSRLIDASSEDTVRTRMLSGKPARMLKSKWTEAWNEPDCPGFLPMPLQGMLVMEANHRIDRAQDKELAFYPVGQVVGQLNQEKACRTIMYELMEGYADTVERMHANLHE